MSIRIRRIVDAVSNQEMCAVIASRVFQALKEDVSQYEKMFSLRPTDSYVLPTEMRFRMSDIRGLSVYLSRRSRREKNVSELSTFLKEALEREYGNKKGVYVEVSDTDIRIVLPTDYFSRGNVSFESERA